MLKNTARSRQADCLYFLAQAGFATLRHFEESGIITGATRHGKTRFLDDLITLKAIERVRIKSPFNVGSRVAFFLTRKGAEMLAELERLEIEDLRYSTTAISDYNREIIRAEFPHKEAYVSALIALAKYLEQTDYRIGRMFHYYDRRHENTTLEIDGKRFRPDGIVFVEPSEPDMPVYRYVLEIHRHSDRKKIIGQLKQHARAYLAGSFHKRFGDGAHFVFSIYCQENVHIVKSVIDELRNDPDTWYVMERYFVFAELEHLKADFAKSCAYFGSSKKPLPSSKK